MTGRIQRLVWVMSFAGILCSCAREIPFGPGPDPSTLSVSLNGTEWTTQSVSGLRASSIIMITAGSGAGTASMVIVSLTFARTGIGTQTFSPVFTTNAPAARVTMGPPTDSRGWNTNQAGGSGSVTITMLTDSRVAGTFNFVASASAMSTQPREMVGVNGTFDVALISPP